MMPNESALFELGQVVVTTGALDALLAAGIEAAKLLARHQRGNYGDLSDGDERLNDEALRDGSRILSAYQLPDGKRIWIITEAAGDDGRRALTTVLLSTEY